MSESNGDWVRRKFAEKFGEAEQVREDIRALAEFLSRHDFDLILETEDAHNP